MVHGDRSEISDFGHHAPELIDHLIGYGLIEKVGDDFDIKFEAIKIALVNMFPANEMEDAWSEISRRRNAIEVSIRDSIFYWSRNTSRQEWSEILERSLTGNRFEALPSHEPSILFSRSESPLYLSDLLMLLKQNDVLPYISDRRSSITSAIDVVNKMRKDAHAKIVNAEDLSLVRAAFEVLEGEFARL